MEALWEKLLFWKKNRMPKENTDFRFVDFAGSELTGVQILDGDFKGVVYHYHKAKIVEEGELAVLKFGFTIVSPANYDIDELKENAEFQTLMGDILNVIITEQKI